MVMRCEGGGSAGKQGAAQGAMAEPEPSQPIGQRIKQAASVNDSDDEGSLRLNPIDQSTAVHEPLSNRSQTAGSFSSRTTRPTSGKPDSDRARSTILDVTALAWKRKSRACTRRSTRCLRLPQTTTLLSEPSSQARPGLHFSQCALRLHARRGLICAGHASTNQRTTADDSGHADRIEARIVTGTSLFRSRPRTAACSSDRWYFRVSSLCGPQKRQRFLSHRRERRHHRAARAPTSRGWSYICKASSPIACRRRST